MDVASVQKIGNMEKVPMADKDKAHIVAKDEFKKAHEARPRPAKRDVTIA
jgi:hypothetical protein